MGGSVKKVGLRIRELERLYGVKNGGDRKSKGRNDFLITQSYLAKQMDMSVETYKRYKQLADMIPELSDAVDTGTITKTTALTMIKELSPENKKNYRCC